MRIILFFLFLPFDTIFLYHVVNSLASVDSRFVVDFFNVAHSPQAAIKLVVFFSTAVLLSSIGAWAFWPLGKNREY